MKNDISNQNYINYQGSKANLSSFLFDNLINYIKPKSIFFDIFSGSGAVANIFKNNALVYTNDSEQYACAIASALLNSPVIENKDSFINELINKYNTIVKKNSKLFVNYIVEERKAIAENDFVKIKKLYNSYPTVWNGKFSNVINDYLSPENIRKNRNCYYLFTFYYACTYFGIEQSLEIDSIIKMIKKDYSEYNDFLFSCLFYAMKETVFSKDGHMAQPLNVEKNKNRFLKVRKLHILDFFISKIKSELTKEYGKNNGKSKIYNLDFSELLMKYNFENVSLIYADPPYTDMQYSRYYHLLNVAYNYNYPELTKTKNGYTKGLYTEGRFQSKLSQHNFAKNEIEKLIKFSKEKNINIAISYAYPVNLKTQATNRYTVSINELIELATKYYGKDVSIVKQDYKHANNRNSEQKKVNEFLIICGKKFIQNKFNNIKKEILKTTPNKKNDLYNSNMYWSQKSFNVCDILIDNLSSRGDIIFDPFMGSGVFVLEAIQNSKERNAIGCDINDVPIYIVKTILSIKNNQYIITNLDNFNKDINELISYYETECLCCKSKSIIKKVVFDKPDRKISKYSLNTINYDCPTCGSSIKSGDSDDLTKMSKKYKLVNIKNTKLIPNSKLAVVEDDDIKNIFTERNLKVLDCVLSIANSYPEDIKLILNYIILSILHLCKITDTHSNSQWPLWIPKKDCVEKNVIHILTKKIEKFKDTLRFVSDNYSSSNIVDSFDDINSSYCNCFLLKKGCQNITEKDIPNQSIDLIITDPPYMDQIPYSEYMQLYKPFLGFDYDLDNEIVVSSSPARNKDKNDYFSLIEKAFKMCSDKLKDGKCLCLYFHDSSLLVWERLIRILESVNFKFVTQLHVDKTLTVKNILSPKKSLNGDSILIFIKEDHPIIHNSSEKEDEIEENIVNQARYMIQKSKGLSTPELYDNGIMEILINNGWLSTISKKYSSLVDIFEKYFHWDTKRFIWTVKK